MDQTLNQLRRAAQTEPANFELWLRLFQAEQSRGWEHKGLDAKGWWSRLAREYQRGPIMEELAEAGVLAAVLLVERFRDPAWRGKILAAELLTLLASKASFIAPELRKGLGHHMREVRDAALEALEVVDPKSQQTLDLVLVASEDEDRHIRGWAAKALARLGHEAPGVQALRRHLDDPDSGVRYDAAEAAGHLGSAELIPDLLPLLADPMWGVRHQAVDALRALCRHDRAPLAAIAARLDDREEIVRQSAIAALEVHLAHDEAAAILLPMALDPEHPRRHWAALQLARLAPDHPETIPILRRHLDEPAWRFRLNVTEALASLASNRDRQAASTLVDDDGANLTVHIQERDHFQERAPPIETAPTPDLRSQALIDAIPDLILRFGDKEREIRDAAVEALANIDGGPEAAQPELLHASHDEDPLRRGWAATALARLSLGEDQSRDRVGELLDDQDWGVRNAAAHACRDLDGAERFIPRLRERLEEAYWQLRINVLGSLAAIAERVEGPERQEIIDLIVTGLDDDVTNVRQHAVQGLIGLALRQAEAFETLHGILAEGHDQSPRIIERLSWNPLDNDQRAALRPIAEELLHDESAPAASRAWITHLLRDEVELSSEDRALLERFQDHENRRLREAIRQTLEGFNQPRD